MLLLRVKLCDLSEFFGDCSCQKRSHCTQRPVGSSEVRAGDEPEGAALGSPPERGDSAVTQGDAA